MTITVVQSVNKIVFPNTDSVADPVTREAFDSLRRVIRTLTNSVTVAGTLNADSGGTGITTYTIGDLIYASGPTTLSKLVDVAAGKPLLSGGIGAVPTWGGTVIGQNFDSDIVTTYLDFVAQGSNPPAPAAGTLRYHAATTQGFTRFEQDNEAPTNLVLGRDNVFIVKNTSGSTIVAGKPVYVTGSTGNVPNVGLAKADVIATLPAVGITLDSIANNAFGQVMKLGVISNINTSAFSTGDQLYVSSSTAGSLQNTRPVSPNLVQRMASVLVSGVGNGSLLIVTAPFVGGLESGTTATTWKFNGHTLSMTADASVSGTNTGDSVSQPVDTQLTAIAALADAAGWLHNDGAGAFAYTTPSTAAISAYSMMFAHSQQG